MLTRLHINGLLLFLSFAIYGSVPYSKGISNQIDSSIMNEQAGVYYSVGEFLRRVPVVQFTDRHFRVRSLQSLNYQSEPLYVLDGIIIDNSYSRANSLVDSNALTRIQFLKSIDQTSNYVIRGSNDVFEILTKKS